MTRLNYTSVWAHSINITSKCEASLVQFNLPGITAGILVELEQELAAPNEKMPERNQKQSSVSKDLK